MSSKMVDSRTSRAECSSERHMKSEGIDKLIKTCIATMLLSAAIMYVSAYDLKNRSSLFFGGLAVYIASTGGLSLDAHQQYRNRNL
jgi:hypothetical protein